MRIAGGSGSNEVSDDSGERSEGEKGHIDGKSIESEYVENIVKNEKDEIVETSVEITLEEKVIEPAETAERNIEILLDERSVKPTEKKIAVNANFVEKSVESVENLVNNVENLLEKSGIVLAPVAPPLAASPLVFDLATGATLRGDDVKAENLVKSPVRVSRFARLKGIIDPVEKFVTTTTTTRDDERGETTTHTNICTSTRAATVMHISER